MFKRLHIRRGSEGFRRFDFKDFDADEPAGGIEIEVYVFRYFAGFLYHSPFWRQPDIQGVGLAVVCGRDHGFAFRSK